MKTEVKAKGGIGRIPEFIREVRQEVKKVSWPSRRETTLMTTVVFVFALVAAIYFMIVDQVIYRILHWIIG